MTFPQPLSLAINGRFLTQDLTGVQRFATEISRALVRQVPGVADLELLVPPGTPASELPGMPRRIVGNKGGHLWEQLILPRSLRRRRLLSLGNMGPVATARQTIVIHDAAVFDVPDAFSWRFRQWYKLIQRGLFARGVKVATVSEFSRQRLAKNFNVDLSRIDVISEGADHIQGAAADPTVLERHQLTGKRFVLAVGSLAPHKNLRVLIDAASALAAEGVELVLTGGGNRRIFEGTSGVPEKVRYLGRVNDGELRALYEAALCFVFPSVHEGFGLPPIEAMLCGCPVIATRRGAVPEVCLDDVVYCDPEDPADFAGALLALARDPALRQDLSGRGRIRAASFTWERAAHQLLDLIVRDEAQITTGS